MPADCVKKNNRLRIADGQRTQDELIDQRKDGRVAADPERQRNQGDGCEMGDLLKPRRAKRMSWPKCINPENSPGRRRLRRFSQTRRRVFRKKLTAGR
jgi:hypothetical protein